VGLERGPLSLVSTNEVVLENLNYGRRDPRYWLRDTPLSVKFGTNFTDKRRPFGRYIISLSKATELLVIIKL
jgi:hypothetical protein